MGRYYSGDIEGKFWFAVQSSDDPSFFGGETAKPGFITYVFSEEDLPTLSKGIHKCEKALGERKAQLDAFFTGNSVMYTDSDIEAVVSLKADERVRDVLAWYARLELGQKIKAYVEEQGSCMFDAEL